MDALRSQLAQSVAAASTARTSARATRKALKAYVLGNYGAAAVQMLTDLGLPVPKAGQAKASTKAVAVVKAAATRKARNTMGSEQKLAIVGQPTQADLAAAVGITLPATTTTPKSS